MASVLGHRGIKGVVTKVGRSGNRQRLDLGREIGSPVVAVGHVSLVILLAESRASSMVGDAIRGIETTSTEKVLVQSRVGNRAGVLVRVRHESIPLAVIGRSPFIMVMAGLAAMTVAGSHSGGSAKSGRTSNLCSPWAVAACRTLAAGSLLLLADIQWGRSGPAR
jgi:hypothetical protein